MLYKNVLTDKQDGQNPHGDGDGLELAGHSVTEHIGDDTDEDAVADAIGQRHDDDGEKGGDGLAIVIPMDALHGGHHHHTHDDKGRRSSGFGDSQKQRTEEQCQGETQRGSEGCETSTTTLAYARGTLHVCGGGLPSGRFKSARL